MDMKGEERIPASREAVWEALNDPEVLKASIPGCQELDKTSDTSFSATVQAKVGPVKAKFKGEVTLSDIDAPNGYTISGEGKGGAAGFAKGGARVSLSEDGGETVLSYDVDANVGGKLAQIGSRLIDSTAKKMAGEFFAAFKEQVVARSGSAAAAAEEDATPPATAADDAPSAPATETPGAETPGAETPGAETPGAEPPVDHTAAATKAATEAVRDVAAQRKGFAPWSWVIALIIVAGLLIYAFQ